MLTPDEAAEVVAAYRDYQQAPEQLARRLLAVYRAGQQRADAGRVTQEDMAAELRDAGVEISRQAVARWLELARDD